MPITVENLCGLIIRSRLHAPDVVKGLYGRWQTEAPDRKNVRAFARWLVAQRQLTPYQATLLSNGYADNFFLGPYKILDRVGKGRMAGVYKAVHPSGQVVAIKVLPPSKARDPQILARFQREADLARQFNHVSVVRTFHYGETNGLHYLVMEFLEGTTLKDFLTERGRISAKETARIGFLAALGLQHLHDRNVIHRDVKPGNLMLCPKPGKKDATLRSMVKLLDVGLGRKSAKVKEHKAQLTVAGVLLGTPEYLAPEQARNASKADARSDLYGLGCTLFHALAGRPPFVTDSPMQQVLQHATAKPPTFQELQVDVPDKLAAIIRTLMEKDPNKRYPTAAKAAEAIRAYLGSDAGEQRDTTLPAYLEAIKQPVKAAMPAAAAASPFPVPQVAAKVAAKPPPPVEKLLLAKRRRRSQVDLPATIAAQPPPPPNKPESAPGKLSESDFTSSVDVIELDLETVRSTPFGLPIPRDLFMVLVGALGVLAVVAVLWLLQWLTASRG